MLELQKNKLGSVLGWLTLGMLLVILYLGLWPYNFGLPTRTRDGSRWKGGIRLMLPRNEVEWLKNGPGLHFGDYGSIFSLEDFRPRPAKKENCALEIWLEPALTEDVATLLAFSTEKDPLQFRLRQYKDSLLVIHDSLDQKRGIQTNEMAVDHVFQQQRRLLVTVSSDEKGTAVYVNGELKGFREGFQLSATEFKGRLVFGDSPEGHESWGGDLRGLATFPYDLSAQRVKADFDIWNSGQEFPVDLLGSPTALYEFREGSGNATRSSVDSAPELVIPARLETMRPVFLKPFWKEYENKWEYWADVMVNILAFVPLGFLFCGYFTAGRNIKRPMWMAMAAGFLVSLTIELGQYYLPMRNSGTTDLITNTMGAGLGALLFGAERMRRIVELGAGKWPFTRTPADE